MKDSLPKKVKKNECGIINLNNSNQIGSHWTAYYKKGNYVEYFDSFGNIPPPLELQKYLATDNIWIIKNPTQTYKDPPICGYECINFLLNKWNPVFMISESIIQ